MEKGKKSIEIGGKPTVGTDGKRKKNFFSKNA
jgi:hypothetical protein